jgi:hypothetical protein
MANRDASGTFLVSTTEIRAVDKFRRIPPGMSAADQQKCN